MKDEIITLHSTMFSINPLQRLQVIFPMHLYIPLCFLLIKNQIADDVTTVILYIPLCFLLIDYTSYN